MKPIVQLIGSAETGERFPLMVERAHEEVTERYTPEKVAILQRRLAEQAPMWSEAPPNWFPRNQYTPKNPAGLFHRSIHWKSAALRTER
jgi:hypothetical protein